MLNHMKNNINKSQLFFNNIENINLKNYIKLYKY